MAITKTEYGWHSSVSGRTESSKEAAEYYEARELAKRNASNGRLIEAQRKLDELPADQVKVLAESMIILAGEAEMDAATVGVLNVWLRTRPEYVNDEHNKKVLVFHLKKAGLWPPIRPTDVDPFFVELRDAGLLHLNRQQLEKQQAEREQGQAQEIIECRDATEEEMYAMPLNELERAARNTYIR